MIYGRMNNKNKVKPYFLLVYLLIITFSKKVSLFDVILDFSFFFVFEYFCCLAKSFWYEIREKVCFLIFDMK
jgi:hypothetical protein